MTDTAAIPLIIALVVLLALSAFFSASETAYSSLNRVRLKSLATSGSKKARRALALSERYDALLSAILIGNNIVNITSSALATVLFVGWLGNAGVTVATIVTTVLVLIFGEISPKTLAKEAPERFAMLAAPVLRGLVVVLTPVNVLLAAWKRVIVKVFKVGGSQGATEEELLTFVEEVRQDGAINAKEEDMIRSVIEFDDVLAMEIATPRVDVRAVRLEDSREEIEGTFCETGFSRLPVYGENMDDIRGVLLDKDFHRLVEGEGQKLADVLRPALFVPRSAKISALLTQLQQEKIHMAVIVDEYGGTLGILTIEDILEELVGEIWDEHDQIREDVVPLADGRYRVRGSAGLDKLKPILGEEPPADAVSAGGWAAEQLGCIPKKGDSFTWAGRTVTVAEAEKNRVVSLLVAPPAEAGGESADTSQ